MSGLLNGLGNVLPMAGAAAGGYAQGHVQKQQMDQQRQTGDASRLLMALQAAAAQRDAAPVSPEWEASMAQNAQGFTPVAGGTMQDQAMPFQAFAASESARKQAAFNVERAKLGVDRDAKVQKRADAVDSDRDRDYELEKRKVTNSERQTKLATIRAMKITDPKVLRFMNRGPNEKLLVEEANRSGNLNALFEELYNRDKFDPDEGEEGFSDDAEPPMPTIRPATKR